MMSLALLPLGLIAILQTSEMAETLRQHARISVLAQTEQTALGERRIILSAVGAARALGAALPELSSDVIDCSAYLRQFIETNPRYVNASYIPVDGQVTCISGGEPADVSNLAVFQSQIADPRERIGSTQRGPVTGRQLVSVMVPIFRSDQLAGFVSLSVPYSSVIRSADGQTVEQPLTSIMFNGDGEIVTYRSRSDVGSDNLPQNHDLRDLTRQGAQVFVDRTEGGDLRTFAVVPLVPGTAYVMSAWPPPQDRMSAGMVELAPVAFPLAMWAVSLIVGYLAVHRLVVRHVRSLGREMRTFARSRRYDPDRLDSGMSEELQSIREEFLRMAETVLRDEAALENALREKNDLLAQKNVLMKEVHHRVKNNLQLISSIMNMQIRKSRNLETKSVVQRLQERVLGLATVHRNLYQAGELGAINAGKLVREIAEQMLAVGARSGLRTEIAADDIVLFPDQAVPLSLLTAEAVTNALKYGRADRGKTAWVRIEMQSVDDHHARLRISNSLGTHASVAGDGTSDGLGTQLIRAFGAQLGADARVTTTPDSFEVEAVFPIEAFRPPDRELALARETA